MTLQEKQYVARLERSHEIWKNKATELVETLEGLIMGQAFDLGQRAQWWRDQAAAAALGSPECVIYDGGTIALDALCEELLGV